MTDLASQLSLPVSAALFVLCALAIAVFGTMLSWRAGVIAQHTGWGQAIVGATLLGGTTSIAGSVTSVWTAWEGYAGLSISNAIGGIAVQTAFLAVADLTYRRANLEHAAASPPNLSQGALLIVLLALPLVAASGPDISVFAIHPATFLLVGGYIYGMHLIRAAQKEPMWVPRMTAETFREKIAEDEPGSKGVAPSLWLSFAVLAAIVAAAGYAIAVLGMDMVERSGFDETAVGSLFTAVSTSLPELVTTLAAVRRGALTLAVGGIIGGNAFDTIFLAVSDVAYRDGSLYHAFEPDSIFLVSISILMTGVLLLGLLRREREGPGRIGFESTFILLLYALTVVVVFN